MAAESSTKRRLNPPTNVLYHGSVGMSMASLMTEITMDAPLVESAKSNTISNPQQIEAEKYDEYEWKGYIEELSQDDPDIKERAKVSLETIKEVDKRTERSTLIKLAAKNRHSYHEMSDRSPSEMGLFKSLSKIFTRKLSVSSTPVVNTSSENNFNAEFPIITNETHENKEKTDEFISTSRSIEPTNINPFAGCSNELPALVASDNDADENTSSYTRMLEEEVIRLKLELAQSQTQYGQNKNCLNKVTEERETLRSHNNSLLKLNKDLSNKNAKFMIELSRLQSSNDVLTPRYQQLYGDFVQLQNESKKLTNEIETMRKNEIEQTNAINTLKKTVEKTSKEKEDLRLENTKLHRSYNDLSSSRNSFRLGNAYNNLNNGSGRSYYQNLLFSERKTPQPIHEQPQCMCSHTAECHLQKELNTLRQEFDQLTIQCKVKEEQNIHLKGLVMSQQHPYSYAEVLKKKYSDNHALNWNPQPRENNNNKVQSFASRNQHLMRKSIMVNSNNDDAPPRKMNAFVPITYDKDGNAVLPGVTIDKKMRLTS